MQVSSKPCKKPLNSDLLFSAESPISNQNAKFMKELFCALKTGNYFFFFLSGPLPVKFYFKICKYTALRNSNFSLYNLDI